MRRVIKVLCFGLVIVAATATAASGGARLARSPFLIALDRETGEERWRFTNPEHGRWDVLGEQRGVVLLAYGSCDFKSRQAIIGVDRDSGEERWRLRGDPPDKTLGAYASTGKAPLVVATVRRTPDDPFGIKRLEGIDARTGETLWSTKPDAGFVVVASGRDVVMLAFVPGYSGKAFEPEATELVGVDRKSGEILWSYVPSILVSPASNPIVNVTDSGRTAIVNVQGVDDARAPTGSQTALDLSTGRELWSAGEQNQAVNGERGSVLFGRFDQPLTAYDPRTHELLWTAKSAVSEVVRATDDIVLALQYGPPQRSVGLDRTTGEVLWERDSSAFLSHLTTSAPGLIVQIEQDPTSYLDTQAVAIDAKTGTTRWTAELPNHPSRNWFVGKNVYGAYGGCGA